MNHSAVKKTRRTWEAAPLLTTLIFAAHRVQDRLEAALDDPKLSLPKVGVLKILAEAEAPIALRVVAERSLCVRSNITQLVDRLERDGLVRREGNPGDRRSIQASLTPAGRKALGEAMTRLSAEQKAILAKLRSEDKERLIEMLDLLSTHRVGA